MLDSRNEYPNCYDKYLNEYPNGIYVREVNILREEAYYKLAKTTKWGHNHYLSSYPNGKYAEEARKMKEDEDRRNPPFPLGKVILDLLTPPSSNSGSSSPSYSDSKRKDGPAWVVVEDKLKETFFNVTPSVVVQCRNGKKVSILYRTKVCPEKPYTYGIISLCDFATLKEAADDACR